MNPRPNALEAGAPAQAAGHRSGEARRRPTPLVDVSDGWELQARCRDEDTALFFGPNGFEPKRDRLAREASAKAICRRCPAINVCRDYAIAEGELYGVWGGLGEADRRAVLERRGIVATAV